MDAKQVLETSLNSGLGILKMYLSDLDDAALLERPGPGCNNLAWQLGHLITSEAGLIESVSPGNGFKLPDGFAEAHAKDKCHVDDPAAFLTKQAYIDLYDGARETTKRVLRELPPERLEDPSPERLRKFVPTVAAMFGLLGAHPLLHAGQFAVVRRKLGKPVVL
ncbi:DinB family protein [Lacipirellula parvula]|uniref:DinB-like domain-containing protein n=1 Tax=Lacipirellula parvula TaxID=2650471 RepID=A0A5K7X753_9BACT|nr:DinB family protein [Lacipirellula parvula]BBO32564.1 hypothetical protein PLANPX_2176 [Lacipirellula parvula]